LQPVRNKRAVQALAEETLDIVIGIKDFYEVHKEKLENASEMRDAVSNLLTCVFMITPRSGSIDVSSRDMNMVYDKCRPILQIYTSSDEKLSTRIKQKIDAWWNRNGIEEKIRNLRDRASRCDRQFMVRE